VITATFPTSLLTATDSVFVSVIDISRSPQLCCCFLPFHACIKTPAQCRGLGKILSLFCLILHKPLEICNPPDTIPLY
jgi:hypothetical protein